MLVSMLTPEKAKELELSEKERLCDQLGIKFLNLSIANRSVPNEVGIREPLDTLVKQVKLGRGVSLHCRTGIERLLDDGCVGAICFIFSFYSPMILA